MTLSNESPDGFWGLLIQVLVDGPHCGYLLFVQENPLYWTMYQKKVRSKFWYYGSLVDLTSTSDTFSNDFMTDIERILESVLRCVPKIDHESISILEMTSSLYLFQNICLLTNFLQPLQ